MQISSEQLGGIIRALTAAFSGWALSHGFTNDQWLAVSGGIVAVVTVLWSLYSNSTTAMIAGVVKSDQVNKVVVSPNLVFSSDSPKVVAK